MADNPTTPIAGPGRIVNTGDSKFAWETISREVRGYWRDEGFAQDAWVAMPEVPGSDEIMKPRLLSISQSEANWDEYKADPIYDPNLPKNIVKGAWPSKGEYLESHFRLLREDAVAPLRDAVRKVQLQPQMDDDRETRIYTHASPLQHI